MTVLLKETFFELTDNFTKDNMLPGEIWNEIETAYSHKNRHYHTLHHLDNLLKQLTDIRNQVADWPAILFSLYFHDIIYNVLKNNNEEKSAVVAEKRMTSLSVSQAIIEKSKAQILATKSHSISGDNDTNIFTDADLSILGADWNTYSNYCEQVRREYSVYPDLMYNPGRKKVLTHFLQMDRIFKTDYFFEKSEAQARRNLQSEFESL